MKTLLTGILLFSLSTVIGRADAAADWTKHCARCHGADGSGNTKVGQKLGVKDYTSAAGQAFSDGEALKMIMEGAKDDAGKPLMPAYDQKLTAEQAQALVAYVRSLKK